MANVNEQPETSGKVTILDLLNRSPKPKIPEIPQIALRFKTLFAKIHPGGKSDIFYEAEKFHFAKLIAESPKLQACTAFSLYGCFIDTAVNGLSFDPSFKHQFLIPQAFNIGTKQEPVWEQRATIQISGPGELVLRVKQGQVKYADNPVLVYEGDEFEYGTKNDKLFLNHTVKLPRKSNHIIAAYVRVVRTDGSVDHKMIDEKDMERFRKASKQGNSPAWVDGIAGMWLAKVVKHAFSKTYPKVRTGDFSSLASNVVDAGADDVEMIENDAPAMQIPEVIDYGIDEGFKNQPLQNAAKPVEAIKPKFAGTDEEAFVNTTEVKPGGVNVSKDPDDF